MSPSAARELLIVGHIAHNTDRTEYGTTVSMGGSAYYCARGASVLDDGRVGLVANVGYDLEASALAATLRIDLDGVCQLGDAATARFTIDQATDGTRRFEADWGAAAQVQPDLLPDTYARPEHVHLSTMPPAQQLAWISHFRATHPAALISVDTFEAFAERNPSEVMAAIGGANLVFANEIEARVLGLPGQLAPGQQMILKRGARGAMLIGDEQIDMPAPLASAIDTTGAGEVLAGVFLAARFGGLDPASALRHAVSVASASVLAFGVDHAAVEQAIADVRAAIVAGGAG